MAPTVKNLPAMQEIQIRSWGQENPLEKEMATQSHILAWRIPMDRGTWGLQSMGSPRVRHSWATKHTQRREKDDVSAQLKSGEKKSFIPSLLVLARLSTIWMRSSTVERAICFTQSPIQMLILCRTPPWNTQNNVGQSIWVPVAKSNWYAKVTITGNFLVDQGLILGQKKRRLKSSYHSYYLCYLL